MVFCITRIFNTDTFILSFMTFVHATCWLFYTIFRPSQSVNRSDNRPEKFLDVDEYIATLNVASQIPCRGILTVL